MFSSSGLFNAISCPYLPACPRQAFCVYSHTALPAVDPSSHSTSTSSLPVSSKTLKRKLNDGSTTDNKQRPQEVAKPTHDKQRPAKRTLEQARQPDPPRQSAVSAMEIAKKRREALDTISPITAIASTATRSTTSAVLLARPQVAMKKPDVKATGLKPSTVSGPPVLKIDLRAHSKPQFRQAVAMQYYKEFLRIYKPLGALGSNFATAHAADQEKDVHSKTNQGSYRSLSATTLQRLKKRPEATHKEDVGIDGVWVDPSLNKSMDRALQELWKKASKYVHPLDALETNGYPVSIPEGVAPALNPTQECDRCQKQFEIKENLSEEDKHACNFHEKKIRNKNHNGERIKYFPCCDGPQGSVGCQEGPHVFKEDDFLCLHGRTPFIETPVGSSSDKQRHAVVAMDCEMCYTAGGFEMIRISVVDYKGTPILDELVKPKHEILDLNSRFSGITSLKDAKLDLAQARELFLELIDKDTIIIGQSLENDFKVLRLIHTHVVDTAILYPHPQHLQKYRFSLQSLAKYHLGTRIQDSEHGHDSFEDAKTCLDLVRVKIEKDEATSK
ncbi:RNA exonuclease 3 [Mortierella polycephala]|uniref:RNA exonuclease 3 n=1 Tax=Mortierella polycephala TaxID=41804 RepID=A0A9P6TVL6_9FUNG|nr:RNA exonuclease 3 [Mortierella polycephala]